MPSSKRHHQLLHALTPTGSDTGKCHSSIMNSSQTHSRRLPINHRPTSLKLASLLLCLLVLGAKLEAPRAAGQEPTMGSRISHAANKLALKLDLTKSSGQLNQWLVKEVAPVMATKLIDNVLQAPKKDHSTKSKSSTAIDTQALADKIVDKLADSIKNKRNKLSSEQPTDNYLDHSDASIKGSNRRGKSLVSDSVHQVVQNLFSKDNRKLFGRAMEKSRLPLRFGANHHPSVNHHNASNSWLIVKEPSYEQHLFVSTDSSQLDENPVVLRAEHGHNMTTMATPHQRQSYNYQNQQHEYDQNLSPLISNLMSSQATNQIGQKLLQHHQNRQQQKNVHINRHQAQQLAPKPWSAHNGAYVNRRQQQQSPYSISVTSDMNIVQATSSPAPPTTTSTTTTTTTTPSPAPIFSFAPHNKFGSANGPQVNQLSSNKFKINNRHQHPSSSWSYANNRNSYHNSNLHRFQHHSPSTSTTSTSTTTTTTTTTTPEPPQTENLETIMDLDSQTSSPVSSILSSVAQSALDSLSQGESMASSDESNSFSSYSNSSYLSSTSTGPTKASPSTTSARHSILSSEAIPTALGAPLYHLTRANFTVNSIMAPPPRRSGSSPTAKAMAHYFQKSLNNLSSTIFGRQSKGWARRLGLSSVLLSGLLYGAAILANPGAPMPNVGLEVLQALTKTKRRRGSRENLLPPIDNIDKLAAPLNAALMDHNVNILYQQPQLIPIIEHLIQQEQQQQQQNFLFSQRSFDSSPIEIENVDSDRVSRRVSPSQIYTLRAMPNINNDVVSLDKVAFNVIRKRKR